MCTAGVEIFNLTNLFHLWQQPSATSSEPLPKISHTFPGKTWFCLQDANRASWCLFTWQPSQCLTPNLYTQWQSNPRHLARMFSYWAPSCQKMVPLVEHRLYSQASAKPSLVWLTRVATRGGICLLLPTQPWENWGWERSCSLFKLWNLGLSDPTGPKGSYPSEFLPGKPDTRRKDTSRLRMELLAGMGDAYWKRNFWHLALLVYLC